MSTANIIGNAIFGLRNKSGGNYIDPAVKESLVGLWKFDQNTNESPTRNIIKNTIKDKGGDLELLNFAYKANSGYNGYPEDFTTYTYNAGNVIVKHDELSFNGNANTPTPIIYKFLNGNDSDLKEYTINFTKIGDAKVTYRYIDINGNLQELELIEGKNKLPYSYVSKLPIDNTTIWIGYKISKGNGCTITQLPLYEGALVTDGKDDMIVSQKTVQEMGITKEITVVSMIHQIGRLATNTNLFTNCIWANTGSKGCNIVNYQTSLGKTGIYGYSRANVSVANNEVVINNILGDKADYLTNVSIGALTNNEKFSVVGYLDVSPQQVTSVAVYWTFIANKVLTTDEINQIIAYFKLDKYVTPQVIYDVKRQGLTNDTPAADWYLKDFSGNGHDMQLYNYLQAENSGIGKYGTDYTKWTKVAGTILTKDKIVVTKDFVSTYWLCFIYSDVPAYKVRVTGLPEGCTLMYREQTLVNGINELPALEGITSAVGFTVNNIGNVFDLSSLVIEQIPDYEGALVSDGKDDYGHADNLPIFKDYTVAIDRAWINLVGARSECLSTKNSDPDWGAFNFELSESISRNTFSFGGTNSVSIDVDRKISYQSKYSYNGATIAAGNIVDGKDLFLFKSRSAFPYYAEAAIWSYLLFPYSLSEFLLERQLKKYKLGTLYPDMVEFRPIINVNIGKTYNVFKIRRTDTNELLYYYINGSTPNNKIGSYLPKGTNIQILVKWDNNRADVTQIKFNGKEYELNRLSDNSYYIDVTLDKSPQKIDIYADEYIRYENIVQPYPAIINLKQDGKTITWGDKLKVGSEITFVNHINLLPEIYAVSGGVSYNGTIISGWNTPIVVAKSMVFTNVHTWKLNTTEPHAIYSPQKLNIPNSSLKILGYVPDLTGKGNHGVTNNFAWALNSGANGYLVDFTTWSKINAKLVTDNKIVGSLVGWICYLNVGNSLPTFKVFISGIPNGGRLRFTGSGLDQILQNGENTIQGVELTTTATGFLSSDNSLDWSNLVIQQIGEHEGSICFDGTDDHITIPTLAHGGKCMMMKVNWNKDGMLYDQRPSGGHNTFGIYTGENHPAYSARNNGSTYIDGILNTNIIPSNLAGITHNITAVNDTATDNSTTYPRLGTSFTNATFSDMSLYEFMLFPEIPSEDEIKKLNDVMGIEGGYVESPNYYWDAYGKANRASADIDYKDLNSANDAHKQLIDKSIEGLAAIELYHSTGNVSGIKDRRLYLNNVGYNSESGYGGKGFVPFNGDWRHDEGKLDFQFITNGIHVTKSKATLSNWFWTNNPTVKGAKTKYKITGVTFDRAIRFFNGLSEYQLVINKDGIYEVDGSLLVDGDGNPTGLSIGDNGWVGDCDIVIEQLTEYPNGLLLDGVDDHAVNTAIPAVTDYTWIMKREILGKGFCPVAYKGDGSTYLGGSMWFEQSGGGNGSCSFGSVFVGGLTFPKLISYQTKTSYNGTSINPGTDIDGTKLVIGARPDIQEYLNLVFYKAMLYTKTIDQLSINMLKNLFERDELIDVTNPIFKKEELTKIGF